MHLLDLRTLRRLQDTNRNIPSAELSYIPAKLPYTDWWYKQNVGAFLVQEKDKK